MDVIKRIERVAIAVNDLNKAKAFYEKLGAQFHPLETIEEYGMEYLPFDIGESKMELLASKSPESVIQKFIESQGQGVHHVTLEVDDLDVAMEELKGRGIRFVGKQTYDEGVTFEGYKWQEAFIHPKDAFGVLIHLAEKKKTKE